MLRSFTSAMARRLGFMVAPPVRASVSVPRRARFRPQLEACEAREVPAALTWTNAFGNNDFYTPANWVLTGTGITAQYAPEMGDDVTFDGSVSSADCPNIGLVPAAGGVGPSLGEDGSAEVYPGLNSLRLINAYAGTVSLVAPLQVGTFVLSAAPAGAIAQPATTFGNDLTVTNSFTWTSGVLNNTSTDATVHLSGASGSITPGTNGLTSGSTFNLDNATTLSVAAGSLNFANGSDVIVAGASSLFVTATQNAMAEFTGPQGSYDKAKIELKSEGAMTILGQGVFVAGNRKITNNGGNLTVKDGVTAKFGLAGILGPPAGTPLANDIVQNSGTITIESGGTLTSSFGAMKVSGGSLFAQPSAAGATSTVGCQLTFAGGTIRINTHLANLKIEGDFYWSGGTFQCSVDVNNSNADQIICNGKMFIGGSATVLVLPLNNNPLPAGLSVRFLYAKQGIKNFVANQAPDLTVTSTQGAPNFKVKFNPSVDVLGDGECRLEPA